MRKRFLGSVCLTAMAAGVALSPAPLAGQDTTDQWAPARTPDGQPDLQGIWANNVATPLERPVAFEGKAELTDEELATLKQQIDTVLQGDDAVFGDGLVAAALNEESEFLTFDEATGNYGQVWLVERNIDNRTSLVIDPPNGRLPALTPAAQQRLAGQFARLADHPADSWADRRLSERCITFGVPSFFAGYNSYYHFLQSAEYVVIYTEMIHDARIIPLDDRPHITDDIRQWHGDSRGHWEGDTLVVDTTNYSPHSDLRGANENLHVIERFTRVGPDTLQYEITVDDPTTWEQPWTAMIPLSRSEDPIFEYACHEGNYGMEGILAGHRAQERAAASR